MSDEKHILLILDIDETLIHASPARLTRAADFSVGPYYVYSRPYLQEFLTACGAAFAVGIWSSASADYVQAIVQTILPAELSPAFVWSRERCVHRFDAERHDTYFVKDLKRVKRLGYDLDRVLIVDDTPQKLERNYGNAIYVRPYVGQAEDNELRQLNTYLESLSARKNVRALEKRNWRQAR